MGNLDYMASIGVRLPQHIMKHIPTFHLHLQSASADTHCMVVGEGRGQEQHAYLNSKEYKTRILTIDSLGLLVLNYPK